MKSNFILLSPVIGVPPLAKFFNRLSLQAVLTVPFFLQVIAVVGVVGYLSFRNGQTAVTNLATQLRSELTARILQQLESTLEQPYVINQINASSLQQGDLEVFAVKGEHQLWQQAQVFSSTNLIYCATETEGAFLGVGRSQGGLGDILQVQIASPATDRLFYYYEIDSWGKRSFLRSRGNKAYDPRVRPWYEAAKQQGEPTWSEVYLDFDALVPVITASTPVYNTADGQLLGVCATDIILSEELNGFLRTLRISKSGIAFIIEPSGLLIASSTPEPITLGRGAVADLLPAVESSNPLIREITLALDQQFDGLDQITPSQQNLFLLGDRQFIETVHFRDRYGLDWIVVLAIPEDDFMAEIDRNTQITLLLCIVALLVTLLVGLIITQWLTRPLRQLSRTAKDIAQGEWDRAIALDRSDAIGDLSRAFATMAHQLKASFATLEERIEERTAELIQLNQELEKLAHIDSLTQTENRRYFDRYLEQEWRRLAREQQNLTLILCDVDHFKQYNDTYGHPAGDRCLQHIAQVLVQTVQRPTDLVARYGGEEFALVLSQTDTPGAIHLAEQIRATLHALHLPHCGGEHQRVTVSLGIATTVPSSKETPQALINAADRALYAAKASGRDGYSVATADMLLNR
jgi:diguanylate cyclase (GGDEF)-like protein